jgi:succinyl-CoA synthetase beta subunit
MAAKGVNVPLGFPAKTVEEAVAAAAKIGDPEVVIKAQILAGGRGLGTFKNGFKGGVHIIKSSQVAEYAGKMLGQTLVTKQSGPAGKPVNTIMIAKKMDLRREMYFSILLNRPDPRALVIACAVGGTSIEDLAHSNPEAIIKVPVDMAAGMSDAQAATIVDGLKCTGDRALAAEQVKALFRLFCECDCTMVEVNPLAEDGQGVLIAADAKVGFDDNAFFRQPEIFKQRDWSQEDPKEVQAAQHDLNYIALDGNIGCMVNGAGLAMATMDIIQLYGGKPANFLDVGGAANEDQVKVCGSGGGAGGGGG